MDSEVRPWGRFEVIEEGPAHKVKSIFVAPRKRLSYQRHKFRAEHWFIVAGETEVTVEGEIYRLKVGQSIDIPIGAAHRMANIGETEVNFIEVQTGSYFGEDDIERLADDFGRSS
jgi:mannose-6-phosphate isomerase